MAKITTEDVEYVAGLAQLILDDDAKQRLVKEMGDILSYMDKLSELNTDDVEPMMHVLDITNVYREDVVGKSLTREQTLKNAPKHDDEFFLVPRILDAD
ncbi:MAG: Asp-tRNA(Asn)/Glu-tRNA(Gln) amidotransferase GatCAB subunit C [Candidatus Hydrogenedentota bacterium]|nr:MAG: Asp-tRNA(Asn)/Glu-tRNA(Gln) amidotransferase GatCAB subunit C [Candidatus Hydrogenedentota bacterium]